MNPPTYSSDVWHHFERMENAGKCLYCSKIIRYTRNSMFSLKRHLATKHMIICMTRIQEKNSSGRDGECHMGQESPTTVLARSATKEPLLARVMKPLTVETKDRLDDYLLQLISQECLPLSTVDSEAFKQFCVALNPNYVVPSSSFIAETILKRKYVNSLQRVKDALANTTQVTLSLDGWTNMDSTSFYALTAHYIDCNYTFCSSLLECLEFSVPHTGCNIAQWISRVIDDFNVTAKNIAAIVTENRPHMISAVQNLNLKHIPCFAHTLNAIVTKSLADTMGDTIEKIRRTITTCMENSTASSKLEELQAQLNLSHFELKHDIPSRWTSTYAMIEKFHKNKVPLLACLDTSHVQNSVKNEDWLVMEQTIKVLQNFASATKIASTGKNLMLSHAGLLVNILNKKISDLLSVGLEDSVNNLARSLLTGLSTIYDPISTVVKQCMLLDPRMKRHSFDNEDEMYVQTYNAIVELLVSYVPTSDVVPAENIPIADPCQQDFFCDFVNKVDVVEREATCPKSKAQKELDEYITAPYTALTADPLVWWKQNEVRFPSLHKLVKHMFCIPASSIPCERVFTTDGQIFNEKRARLDAKHASEIMFVLQNGF